MKLNESDPRLTTISRSVETLTVGIAALQNGVVSVELLASFDSLSEMESFRNTPSAYCDKKQTILVNQSRFFDYSQEDQEIVLIHEIGHYYLARIDPALKSHKRFSQMNEDMVVDLMLCQWGFEERISAERNKSYGEEYAKALKLWRNTDEYARSMTKIYWKKMIS